MAYVCGLCGAAAEFDPVQVNGEAAVELRCSNIKCLNHDERNVQIDSFVRT
jgi:hypothetical protein